MGCSRASHFSHVSASRLRVACRSPATNVRSVNGGWHGLAGWCFRRLPETGAGLWADDGGNSLPDAGSSIAAANLRLAEFRKQIGILPDVNLQQQRRIRKPGENFR